MKIAHRIQPFTMVHMCIWWLLIFVINLHPILGGLLLHRKWWSPIIDFAWTITPVPLIAIWLKMCSWLAAMLGWNATIFLYFVLCTIPCWGFFWHCPITISTKSPTGVEFKLVCAKPCAEWLNLSLSSIQFSRELRTKLLLNRELGITSTAYDTWV